MKWGRKGGRGDREREGERKEKRGEWREKGYDKRVSIITPYLFHDRWY